jgi:CheY-like chemotaxis protein
VQTKTMNTVLIIENDATVRADLEEELRGEGFEVIGAGHGAAGLAAAREYLPDLVLCAEQMSGMDGYHVARLLRQDAETGHPRFLLLVEGEYPAFLQGMIGGVDGFLHVPPAPGTLRAAVRDQLSEEEEGHLTPPVPHIPLSDGNAPHAAGEILANLAGVTGELLDVVEKFLRFTQVKMAVERRRIQAKTPGPRPAVGLVHSNQVGSLAQVAADARGRSADLNCHLEKGFLPLEMEELAVMVGEVVENSCRFSVPGAPIDVFYFRQGEGSEVMVRDYGVGMTPHEIEAIRSSDSARARDGVPPGERLGLAMVRMIAESRGGRLLVHSVPAVGTTVRILIPDATSAERAADAGRTERSVSDLGVPPFEEGGGTPF